MGYIKLPIVDFTTLVPDETRLIIGIDLDGKMKKLDPQGVVSQLESSDASFSSLLGANGSTDNQPIVSPTGDTTLSVVDESAELRYAAGTVTSSVLLDATTATIFISDTEGPISGALTMTTTDTSLSHSELVNIVASTVVLTDSAGKLGGGNGQYQGNVGQYGSQLGGQIGGQFGSLPGGPGVFVNATNFYSLTDTATITAADDITLMTANGDGFYIYGDAGSAELSHYAGDMLMYAGTKFVMQTPSGYSSPLGLAILGDGMTSSTLGMIMKMTAFITPNDVHPTISLASQNLTVVDGVYNTVVLGGHDIRATESNTVYMAENMVVPPIFTLRNNTMWPYDSQTMSQADGTNISCYNTGAIQFTRADRTTTIAGYYGGNNFFFDTMTVNFPGDNWMVGDTVTFERQVVLLVQNSPGQTFTSGMSVSGGGGGFGTVDSVSEQNPGSGDNRYYVKLQLGVAGSGIFVSTLTTGPVSATILANIQGGTSVAKVLSVVFIGDGNYIVTTQYLDQSPFSTSPMPELGNVITNQNGAEGSVVDFNTPVDGTYSPVIKFGDNTVNPVTMGGANILPAIISSNNSTIAVGVVNSVILGGNSITASESNTAYAQNLVVTGDAVYDVDQSANYTDRSFVDKGYIDNKVGAYVGMYEALLNIQPAFELTNANITFQAGATYTLTLTDGNFFSSGHSFLQLVSGGFDADNGFDLQGNVYRALETTNLFVPDGATFTHDGEPFISSIDADGNFGPFINTLDPFTWTKDDDGTYAIILSEDFTASKQKTAITVQQNNANSYILARNRGSIEIKTPGSDLVLENTLVTIKVYA